MFKWILQVAVGEDRDQQHGVRYYANQQQVNSELEQLRIFV